MPYKERGLKLPALGNGLEYGNMGCMECSIDEFIAHRMKHKKGSWSKRGVLNLGRLIVLKLTQTIDSIGNMVLSEEKTKEIIEILSALQAPKREGHGYEGKHARIPFEDCAVTDGRQAIKKMFVYTDFYDMCYS